MTPSQSLLCLVVPDSKPLVVPVSRESHLLVGVVRPFRAGGVCEPNQICRCAVFAMNPNDVPVSDSPLQSPPAGSEAAPASGFGMSQTPFGPQPQPVTSQAPVSADLQVLSQVVAQLASVVGQQAQTSAAVPAPREASGSFEGNYTLANKVLKYPDGFGSDDFEKDCGLWFSWSMSFRNWLEFAEPVFESELREVEQRLDEQTSITGMPEACALRGKRLWTILSTLLKGRALGILRSVTDRNGYEVWRLLVTTYSPKTRSRSLAMLSAIMQQGRFTTKGQTLLEQITAFERLVHAYEDASSSKVPDDILLSILVRCCPNYLTQHVHLRMTPTTTYQEVRAMMISYEVSTTRWTPTKVAADLGITSSSAAPMDVDEGHALRIKGKDKGKGKDGESKDKGKGKDGKGKDKGKGKDSNGKGKGGAKDSKGNAKGANQAASKKDVVCHYCWKKGHYKSECRKLQADQKAGNVRQVEGAEATPSNDNSKATSSTDNNSSNASTRPSATVRRIAFDLTAPDCAVPSASSHAVIRKISTCSSPEWFDMTCADHVDDVVTAPEPLHFDLTYSDEDGEWTKASNCTTCVEAPLPSVRAVCHERELDICVDSCADESCIPYNMSEIGFPGGASRTLQDAQGHPMTARGTRLAVLDSGTASFRESWVISPVSQPIFAVGKLLRRDWRIVDMQLMSPDGDACVPLHFEQNSLMCRGVIRVVSASDVEVTVSPFMLRCLDNCDYMSEVTPGVFGLRLLTSRFPDIAMLEPYEGLCYRTTLVRKSRTDPWHLLELSEPLELLEQGKLDRVIDATQPNHPFDCVVFGHRTVLTPGELGFEYVAPSAGSEAPVPAPAGAPPGLVESDAPGLDAGEVLGVEVEGAADTALAGPQDDGQAEAVMQDAIHDHGGEMPESITIDDVVLTAETNLRTLRAACQSLQVGKSGSRATVFKRLVERLRQMKVAASAAVHAESIPEVIVPSQPAEPTPEARRQHESTHLPYAPWCEVCVAHKARDNAHHPTDPAERIPTISFDFGFSSRDDDGRQELCCLFLHDSVTGWREAIAVPGKGGVHGGLHVQAEVCRLLAFLDIATCGFVPIPNRLVLVSSMRSPESVSVSVCGPSPAK